MKLRNVKSGNGSESYKHQREGLMSHNRIKTNSPEYDCLLAEDAVNGNDSSQL
jgi:hypothetical protein